MPRYSVTIQVSAQRLPDPPPPQPAFDPGTDPIREMTQVMRESMTQIGSTVHRQKLGRDFSEGSAGMSKTVAITVESFAALAEILGRFDSLGEEIECSHPVIGDS
jgi:hypothetical protein